MSFTQSVYILPVNVDASCQQKVKKKDRFEYLQSM